MTYLAKLRLLCALCAASMLGVAMTLANGIPPNAADAMRTLAPMILGAGLSQWLLFPLFARRSGAGGVALDVALFAGMIALAGGFAGTLVMPGAGTILGPMVTLSLPLQSPLAAVAYALGAVGLIRAIRRAKSDPAGKSPPVP